MKVDSFNIPRLCCMNEKNIKENDFLYLIDHEKSINK